MVYRIFVEKKAELANEAKALLGDINDFLGIKSLTGLRLFNRYDVEGISAELFDAAVQNVLSEPQLDITYTALPECGNTVFAVEYLPGQYDQRADSAAQCIQFISQGDKPAVRTARIYALTGNVSEAELAEIKKYVINPVEAREAGFLLPETLKVEYDIPTEVETLEGFTALEGDALDAFLRKYGLAMDRNDLICCRDYFASEHRDPTLTEIRVIDTYWSDHCRHTTFNTVIDEIVFEDDEVKAAYEEYLSMRSELNRTKPITLMDMGTIGAKYLKKKGLLTKLDESEEINACTVKIKVKIDGEDQDWLLLFKNETHNHPTEIEPFGGAATCIGGAIRDPLSGRSYVYGAMRVTGAADPRRSAEETLKGKLPQKKLVTTAAAGYSSYGNQIGLATGQVDELYHDGYAAKRMEIGAVIAAAPAENVRRERPAAGDIVILLGGRTGRDGIGGATGSSKAHDVHSVETCGSEVQKGNAPEERKLQRLFRMPEASKLIKRCNDFGAGGVAVAVGELADGLDINLNAVPKKYEGLDGTELAISESQERMAVVVEAKDAELFMQYAAAENLEATIIAVVKDDPSLTMNWNGKNIVNIKRAFLDTNGAERHTKAKVAKSSFVAKKEAPACFGCGMKAVATDLNTCSKRGLSERFDSTIGAGTVIMPFGGKYQLTPNQAMVQKISLRTGETDTVSLMSWGYNPYIAEKSPYHGAYLAVVESASKLIAQGATLEDTYLTFQEYFERLNRDETRWGKPAAAVLGALMAQKDLGIAAIGGKDSMSGSFESLDVPPTLVSFAVTTAKTSDIVSGEFKKIGSTVIWIRPEYTESGLPKAESLKAVFAEVNKLCAEGKAAAVYTPGFGGCGEAVLKMAIGNKIGFTFNEAASNEEIFGYSYGSFVIELTGEDDGTHFVLGKTNDKGTIERGEKAPSLEMLLNAYEGVFEGVYSCNIKQEAKEIPTFNYKAESRPAPAVKVARPKVLIPAFPGTNCEFDGARAFERAGAETEIVVIRNLTPDAIAESAAYFVKKVGESQIIFIPGGFSGGDEPDGSAKFITSFFRNPVVKDSVHELLKSRDGLMAGICNGFQALIKLGLVPYGEIRDNDAMSPTLTFNTIGRHQSRIVGTRVASNKSPWLMFTEPGEVYNVPISHGEGRFLASDEVVKALAANGQIATQYVDLSGVPTADIRFNPNNSTCAIEGICSPDGRVFGKMGHSERIGSGMYVNVPGNYDIRMFDAAVEYFK